MTSGCDLLSFACIKFGPAIQPRVREFLSGKKLMLRQVLWAAIAAALTATAPQASAQFFGGGSGCSSCGGTPTYSPPPMYSAANNCAPVSTVSSCTPIQPVYSACYQTVPVTTYKQEERTIQEPYYTTKYVDQKVVKYEPVTRQQTVEVPFVTYKTVQDNRVVTKDMGRWVTNYQPIKKCNACEVDPRPGMLGWLNRTGYSFRSAFTPNYRTSRQYVPNMMACNVASTRQVAVQGTRKVVQNVTQMVAKETTERVAVQELAYRKKVVQVRTPVTAYRTVPIGSALAYGGYGGSLAYGGFGGSGLAFVEDEDDSQTALRPTEDSAFGDSGLAKKPFPSDDEPLRSGSLDNSKRAFQGSGFSREVTPPRQVPTPRANQPTFPPEPSGNIFDGDSRRSAPRQSNPQPRLDDAPIVLRGWTARKSTTQTASATRPVRSAVALSDRD